MAVIFFDDPSIYRNVASVVEGRWDEQDNLELDPSGSARSGQALKLSAASSYLEKTVPTPGLTFWVGFRFKVSAWSVGTAGSAILSFQDAVNGAHWTLRIDTDGTLRAQNKDTTVTGSQIGSNTTKVIQPGTWYYIEIYQFNDNSGDLTIKIDGSVVLEEVGTADTMFSGNVDDIRWRNAEGDFDFWFHDVYILDDAAGEARFLGHDTRVDNYYPNAVGDQEDYTASGSPTNNYENADDVGDSDLDGTYLESSTIAEFDLYNVQNLAAPVDVGQVFCVQVINRARKDDASAKSGRALIKEGATEAQGSTEALNQTYTTYTDMWETNPDTTNQWTKSEVDSAQIGFEVVA